MLIEVNCSLNRETNKKMASVKRNTFHGDIVIKQPLTVNSDVDRGENFAAKVRFIHKEHLS